MTLTTSDDKIKRAFATHAPMWQRFQTDVTLPSAKTSETLQNVYQRQYSHVYAQRLHMLKPRCLSAVPENVTRVGRVLDLREDVPCVVVGTLVKECEDASEEPIAPSKLCRNSDVLYLEDESGRVTLSTDQVHQWSTGVVVAVEGVVKEGGVFHVSKFFSPTVAPSPNIEGELQSPSNNAELAPHVLLISGLHCAAPGVCSFTRDMLLEYLQGNYSPIASKVCRVIIAGNSAAASTEAVKELDGWIAQVCATGIPVDLMPGQDDPSTANWPQRPFHSSLLKYGGSFVDKSLLSRTPNPLACGLGDKYVVGTDGRNVSDLVKHLETNNELEALKLTLQWGHVCPTGPSSVPTVPSGEIDPMVLEETPHLYFAGNCENFATDLMQATRIVCVPKFSATAEAVLVNLKTLNCEVLRFDDEMVEM